MRRNEGIDRLLHDLADGGAAGQAVPGDVEILEKILGGLVAGDGFQGSQLRTFGFRGAGSLRAIRAAAGPADFAVGSAQLGRIDADIQIQPVGGRRVVRFVLASLPLFCFAARKSRIHHQTAWAPRAGRKRVARGTWWDRPPAKTLPCPESRTPGGDRGRRGACRRIPESPRPGRNRRMLYTTSPRTLLRSHF